MEDVVVDEVLGMTDALAAMKETGGVLGATMEVVVVVDGVVEEVVDDFAVVADMTLVCCCCCCR